MALAVASTCCAGGAALPVVGDVVDGVEPLPGERGLMDAASLRSAIDVLHPAAERMFRLAVQNGDFVARGEQPLDQQFADEQRPADYENAHRVIASEAVQPTLRPQS